MGNNRDRKRAALLNALVDAAERQIAAGGLAGLKAREVTAEAGCALGALYNVVENLDMLVLHVNARTLARLGAALAEAVHGDDTPEEIMLSLAVTYVGFALENRHLWQSLFDHRLAEGVETPDWHIRDHAVLIEQIIKPLSRLRPDLSDARRLLRARTIFAAVHGVVQLSLQGRYVGVPAEELSREVEALVRAMTRGVHLVPPGH